jgi:hypothetical protein
VPTGIQQLLRLASVDHAFRRALVERRAQAAAAVGVVLTSTEQQMLESIDAKTLGDMAEKLPAAAAGRRELLRGAAASALVLLGGATLAEGLCGCEKRQYATAGAVADLPPDGTASSTAATSEPSPERPTRREMEADGGASPHLPPSPEPDRSGSH